MSQQSQIKSGELKRLATGFGKLSVAENRLLDNVRSGKWTVCGPNDDDDDSRNDPQNAAHWGAKRRIRAKLIIWLCQGLRDQKHSDSCAIRVYGAEITGDLNLPFFKIPFPLSLVHCCVKGTINLSRAELPELDFEGSLVNDISAASLIVKHYVFMRKRFTATGDVTLQGAQIGRDLDCDGASFTNQENYALRADGIEVKGNVFLGDKFNAQGQVSLQGAQIGGTLSCDGGSFTKSKDAVTSADGTTDDIALRADGIEVKGNISLSNGFTAQGQVNLQNAQIGDALNCSGGNFTNLGNDALRADGIRVEGSVFLGDGFVGNGAVSLADSQIGGDLDCSGGTFINLTAAGIVVKGAVFLRRYRNAKGKETQFVAKGEVNLVEAQIDGQLDCSGGDFSRPDGFALNAYRAVVKSSFFLFDVSTEGRVYLSGARIAGTLDCAGGNFQNATLDLSDASAGALLDSGLNDVIESNPTVWPRQDKLFLDGFVYGRILSEGRIDADKRITSWLALQRQSPLRPQPYLQLAKVLRESGDDKGAKRVLIEMEDRLRKNDFWSRLERPLLRLTVGYGYDPIRAFWWAAGLSGLGWIIYRRSYLAGGMVPTDNDACAEFRKAERKLPAEYPSFSPLVYSVENSLPLVKLGQGDKWQPDPDADYINGSHASPALGYRGTWIPHFRQRRKSQAESGVRAGNKSILQLPIQRILPGSTGATSDAGSSGPAAATAPASAPTEQFTPARNRIVALLNRLLVTVGLKPSGGEITNHISFLRRFGTSPRFVTSFLWVQILLGWLLATLVVAGVSGLVHKE
jgi:hypothetical protein